LKGRNAAIALALAAQAACWTSFDAELREGKRAPLHLQPLSTAAPALAYELIVIAPNDKAGRNKEPVALSERVGRELDELLRERGVRPTRLEATPVAGRWLRLTLTRGRERMRLEAERWEGDRLLGRSDHATPVHQVREDVGKLLVQILGEVAAPPP
jgi:hypothetical protein